MKKDQQTENGVKVGRKVWLYAALAAGVLVFAAAIVLIVLAVNGAFVRTPTIDNDDPVTSGSTGGEDNDDDDDVGTVVSFVNPMSEMTLLTEQGFFFNSTLDCYYEHVGVDISAEAGSEVYAVCNGTIESVYTDDVLSGTQIVLVKDDGVRAVYSYVDPVEGLEAGDTVTQGQLIATVAEPTGSEYKAGAHLHIEMYVGDELADPSVYFTFDEK